MKKYIMAFSTILFFIFGCSQNKEQEMVSLKGEYLDMDEVYMKFPYRIGFYGGKNIILLDLASDSCFYHVLSYPQMKYSYSIEVRGDGPKETILPTPFYSKGDKLWTLDGARSIIRSYSAEKGDTAMFSCNLHLPLNVDFAMMDDSTALVEDMSGKSRILLVDLVNKSNIPLYRIPNGMNQNTKDEGYLWRSFMAYNPQLNKIALASQFGDVLEVYDIGIKDSLVVEGEGGKPRKDKQIEGYCDIKWKGDSIWTLYSGRNREELKNKAKKGIKMPDGGNIIKVYSQDGTLIATYSLDCYINGFYVDEDRIVGITSNSDSPIVVFRF